VPDIGLPELLIIIGILVLLFGAGRVAELGGALGRAVREFRRGLRDEDEALGQSERRQNGQEPGPAAPAGDGSYRH
jgi:sec-independent protein translocase protein TatA